MSDAEIEAENRSGLWREAAGHLYAAVHSIEQAQGTLEDVNIAGVALAEQLDKPIGTLRTIALVADREAGAQLRETT